MSDAGLPIDARPGTAGLNRSQLATWALMSLLLSPLALIGMVIHAPTYQLIRAIAFRYSGELDDVTATVKLLAGLLLFPATWLILSSALAFYAGSPEVVLVAATGPIFGWAALRFSEMSGALRRRLAPGGANPGKMEWSRLLRERAAVAEEMARLLHQI
jgi:hypothetical protein